MTDHPEQAALVQQDHGSPLPVFSGPMMSKALEAYKELQRALDASMPDSIMTLEGRPYRKKSYWRAVAVAFNLSVEPISEQRETSGLFGDGRDNFGFVVTYRATAPNGRSAIGDGACFAVEKARRFKCPHPEKEGSRRTLHFPPEACPDFNPAFQWLSLPAQSTEHNIRGHAHTRAYNRAVSNLVGFGEVSAEEVARDEHATVEEPAAPTRQAEKPAVSADGSTTVKDVKEKKGGPESKPWLRFDVSFADGRRGSTFDKTLGEQAHQLRQSGASVVPSLEQKEKGVDLTGLGVPPVAVPKPEPEAPSVPETVMITRMVKSGDGTPWMIIQGSEREYVTDNESFMRALDGIKADKALVLFRYELVPTPSGGNRRKLTGIEDPHFEQAAPPVNASDIHF